MPLSKIRMRERKRFDRANVKPKLVLVKPESYEPIPNCPDGRWRSPD